MIEYSLYELQPLSALNAKSSKGKKRGMYLRVKNDSGFGYADYFPHAELGDLSVEDVVSGKRDIHFEKALWFATNEKELRQRITARSFKNHCLYKDGKAERVLKVKVFGKQDFTKIRKLLQNDVTVRLDSNGAISVDQWNSFLKELEADELGKIEYIEDPGAGDWGQLIVPAAKDFTEREGFDYVIHKANARFLENNGKAIFSSYMGSDLGRYHCWLELMDRGDLELVHGINTPGLYQDQLEIFNCEDGVCTLNESAVDEIYANLNRRSWTCLK